MFSRHMPHLLFAVILMYSSACCSSGELDATQKILADAEASLESKDREISDLQQQIAALEAENTSLKQTAQFHFNTGVDALSAGNWAEAKAAFSAVVERFPSDPLVPEAKIQLLEAEDGRLGAYLAGTDSTLSLSDKGTYTSAATELEGLIDECGRCSNTRSAQAKLRSIRETLDEWPEEITSIKSMKVRYSDLRGKPLRVSRATITASTYYNCRYDSDTTWRSFELALDDVYESLNAYCRKGSEPCERLFERVASGSTASIRDVQLQYPSSNGICGEGQIELVGWSE